MSWLKERKRSWLESLCIRILKLGPIPRHLAFIMDGNRRYAAKLGLNKVEGHVRGSDKLSETLEWCLDLGITEVTVYAFSIENFKRSAEEVDGLMQLIREKLRVLLDKREKLDQNGICIRVLGALTLLPVDIQKLVAEAVLSTQNNNRAYLNVCLAYSSREEICSAVRDMACGVEEGIVMPSDVSEGLLERSLYTHRSPNPDIVVRTSGEVRLSDFLLLQSSFSILAFVGVLWPEFSIWHLFALVLRYQIHRRSIQDAKEYHSSTRDAKQSEEDSHDVDVDPETVPSPVEKERVAQCVAAREKRITAYLHWLQDKRQGELLKMKAGLSAQQPCVGDGIGDLFVA